MIIGGRIAARAGLAVQTKEYGTRVYLQHRQRMLKPGQLAL